MLDPSLLQVALLQQLIRHGLPSGLPDNWTDQHLLACSLAAVIVLRVAFASSWFLSGSPSSTKQGKANVAHNAQAIESTLVLLQVLLRQEQRELASM